MVSFIKDLFSWLPPEITPWVSIAFALFGILILFLVIKLLIALFKIQRDIFGGLISKVVSFFV